MKRQAKEHIDGCSLSNGSFTPLDAARAGRSWPQAARVPAIAARSRSYNARQLNDFRKGMRNGSMAALMKPRAAKLTDTNILDITAGAGDQKRFIPSLRF